MATQKEQELFDYLLNSGELYTPPSLPSKLENFPDLFFDSNSSYVGISEVITSNEFNDSVDELLKALVNNAIPDPVHANDFLDSVLRNELGNVFGVNQIYTSSSNFVSNFVSNFGEAGKVVIWILLSRTALKHFDINPNDNAGLQYIHTHKKMAQNLSDNLNLINGLPSTHEYSNFGLIDGSGRVQPLTGEWYTDIMNLVLNSTNIHDSEIATEITNINTEELSNLTLHLRKIKDLEWNLYTSFENGSFFGASVFGNKTFSILKLPGNLSTSLYTFSSKLTLIHNAVNQFTVTNGNMADLVSLSNNTFVFNEYSALTISSITGNVINVVTDFGIPLNIESEIYLFEEIEIIEIFENDPISHDNVIETQCSVKAFQVVGDKTQIFKFNHKFFIDIYGNEEFVVVDSYFNGVCTDIRMIGITPSLTSLTQNIKQKICHLNTSQTIINEYHNIDIVTYNPTLDETAIYLSAELGTTISDVENLMLFNDIIIPGLSQKKVYRNLYKSQLDYAMLHVDNDIGSYISPPVNLNLKPLVDIIFLEIVLDIWWWFNGCVFDYTNILKLTSLSSISTTIKQNNNNPNYKTIFDNFGVDEVNDALNE